MIGALRVGAAGIVCAAALGGCEFLEGLGTDVGTGDSGLPTATTPFDAITLTTETMRSDANGAYVVRVQVPPSATSFQVTSVSPQLPALERVVDPNGDEVLFWRDLYQSPNNVTQAVYASRQESAFNWPIQAKDGPLIPGVYELEWALVDLGGNYAPDAKVDVTTAIKRDDDLASGEVHVRILWARGIDAQPKVTSAVEQAVEHWREVWSSIGLTLVERYESTDLDPNLDFTWEGSAAVNQVAQTKDKGELQLVVGETVDGDGYIYGVSAGIPGTIIPSRSTFVVMSWVSHAGPDGKFSANDIQVMGETMAHETGHYIGLFHPVEMSYRQWDDLRDTEECGAALACERDLGVNLMFPYSLCGFSSCESQYQLTDDQAGVLQQAPGTL